MAAVAAAVEGGVALVQLREKDLPADELLRLALQIRAVTRGRALLVINDRVDVALACDADGVHLPGNGLPTGVARALLGPGKLVGRSAHSVGEAVEAERDGANYVLLGTIFPTSSHPDTPAAGPGLIRAARSAVHLPLIAIGGIDASNVRQVMEAGADGVAVISAILAERRSRSAARALVRALRASAPASEIQEVTT